MVGGGGAQAFRKVFFKLSSVTYTPIPYWQSLKLFELQSWIETAVEEEGEDDG
ncbi:hypothetical protein OXB_2974 [Bacillus sp. OxB-1]|nr:hypothetical protein OXB_2974 [Bacillus sp. OxB-1]